MSRFELDTSQAAKIRCLSWISKPSLKEWVFCSRCTKSSTKASQELKITKHRLRNELGFSRVRRQVKQGNKRLTYGLNRVQPSNLGFLAMYPLVRLAYSKKNRHHLTLYAQHTWWVFPAYSTKLQISWSSIGHNSFVLSRFPTNFISMERCREDLHICKITLA